MTEDDVIEDGLWDTERVEDLSVDVGALHAQRWRRPIRLSSRDTRVQRLHSDRLRLLGRLHAPRNLKSDVTDS